MALASLPERFNSPVSSFIFANRAQTRTLKVGRSFATYAQDDEDVAAAAVDESTEPADAFAEDASAKDDVPAAEDAPEEGAAAAFAATPVKNNRRVDQGTYNARTAASQEAGRRLFIANLNYDTTWTTLKDHFKQAGNVLYANIKTNGRGPEATSRGMGIVEFETRDEAQHAIATLDESELEGRYIMVREDVPPASRNSVDRRGQQDGEGQRKMNWTPRSNSGAEAGCKIMVGGLPYRVTWQDLKDIGNQASDNQCTRSDVQTDRETGRSRGFGFLTFATPEAAEMAIQAIQGSEMDGRFLTAKIDEYTS
eukprot:CAMPEP_0206142370 /NCGR_PEP_ID=MMETSP1473-20131121/16613_1 /ASSEMBLY_ACC=CAM_ASM_001109 /TAXON_ID=1461547 /ORGANISM="Stichococcus sp, Strain RCC1054" /LENGTH=309 /DNA_ID=CAMNT_0053537347 /DNA_START=227 /DNA_END=1156 /DNA_ORIENTATION=+